MKKVLVVGDFISGSGLTQVIFNVFSRFPREKYQIEAVGYGIDPEGLTAKQCKQLGWLLYRVVPVTKKSLEHWKWWKNFFKSHSYDIVYFNYSSSWNYLPVIYAKRYGKAHKVVCHSHNSYFSHEFSNRLLMSCLTLVNNHGKKVFNRYADQKIATSKEAARWMFGEDQDVFISINGINIPKFSFSVDNRNNIRQKLKLDDDTKLVGFVGVLQERKNPLFALKVFKKYHELNPNSKFLMLGKGPLKEQINEKIQELGIRDSVIQYDFIADVNRWYSAMDALLFTSMYEGLSLVAIESQISNLQVLASDTNVAEIFATENIKKMKGLDLQEWVSELHNSLAVEQNRDFFNEKLAQFSIEKQAQDIEKLM